MLARPLLFALALSTACTPQDSGDTDAQTTTNASTGSSGTGDVPTTGAPALACDPPRDTTDDCCCFTDEVTEDNIPLVVNSCFVDKACPNFLLFQCAADDPECPAVIGASGGPGELVVNDEAGLECVLAALRDGTPGQVGWVFSADGGYFAYDADQYIQTDRTVFVVASRQEDSDRNYFATARKTLKPAQYFSDCLADPDPRARALCLVETTTDTVTTCLPGEL